LLRWLSFVWDVNGLEFFQSQESLTNIQWILRSTVSFAFLLLVAKLMGQRSISQLRFLDFIIALTLGNIIAHPLSDGKIGLKGSMIATIVIIMLYVSATWLSLKWPFFKRYLDPPPIKLIIDGRIQFDNLCIARISIDYIFSELRKQKVTDIEKVSLALWEPGGTISVFISPQYQPLTPADMKLKTSMFTLQRPIIIDGKIDKVLLKEIGKDDIWLKKKVAPTYTEISEVTLATVDENEKVRVYSSPKG